jgi:hypothetical protein
VDRHRFGEAVGEAAEELERGAFGRVAGEWVDHSEGSGGFGAVDVGEAGCRGGVSRKAPKTPGLVQIEFDRMTGPGWERGEKLEREMADEIAEFGAIGSVPGNDGVEGGKAVEDMFGREQAEAVKSSRNNGLSGIGEADERDVLAGAPDFGVIGAKRFEGREAEDEITDGTWTNQKASQMNHLL